MVNKPEGQEAQKEHEIEEKARREQPENIYKPDTAILLSALPLTEHETFYELRLDSLRELGHMPGQFVEISLPGFGEAPISVSSSPTQKGSFQLVVRTAGNVTLGLTRLKPQDRVGVRGPFGTSFPVDGVMKGRDVLLVCGGIGLVPVRSVINYVLDNRNDYGQITILYGMKNPSERLFAEEQGRWRRAPGVTVMETVDHGDKNWHGHVGLITELFSLFELNTRNTIAIVCGPPVMYRFVLEKLHAKGLSDEAIYLSLERRMKCGVGKCGHCQINGIYVCQEGPVFRYADIKGVEEAI